MIYPIFLNDNTDDTTFWLEDVIVEDFMWEFKVYESKIYTNNFEDCTDDDIELYVSGTIKWDGCSHVWFGNKEEKGYDGYLHLCGEYCWENHNKLMSYLWSQAPIKITKWNP